VVKILPRLVVPVMEPTQIELVEHFLLGGDEGWIVILG
jgi:hypothetical protein